MSPGLTGCTERLIRGQAAVPRMGIGGAFVGGGLVGAGGPFLGARLPLRLDGFDRLEPLLMAEHLGSDSMNGNKTKPGA